MGVNDIFFKRTIKIAFSRVKDHILHIEKELKEVKEEVKAYREEIKHMKKRVIPSEDKFMHSEEEFMQPEDKFMHTEDQPQLPVEPKKPNNTQNRGEEQVSSGNEGGYSFIHSFTKHSFNNYSQVKHSQNEKSDKFQGFKQDFDKIFDDISKQEFLTFLTIYQLEEDINKVMYVDVARKLKLTEGCIRTYVSSLLKKGLPLVKKKYNNKQVFLYILPEFRSLDLKQKLINTFYQNDPNQKTLQGHF